MQKFTRRSLLGSTVGAASVFAGCSESSSSGSFTRTAVEGQQLVVEFEESLEADSISVIDPDGEAFAETSLSAGASRVTFDIGMPYTPGEYRIVAANDETVAETTQVIQPELEIVDVGVGANRMDEMPEYLGQTKVAEAIIIVQNNGTGPEQFSQLQLSGDIPNPRNLDETRIGIYDPELESEATEPVVLESSDQKRLISSTLPFSFHGDGVACESEPQTGRITVTLRGEVQGTYAEDFEIKYTASESFAGCDISLEGDK